MYLKELSINGFKSFARKTELEFTTPITAIVGPNGSGKSNVAEAFRFVLGEQSIKSMRGKKGEDLIWGGSESVSRANRASVSIKLLNPQKNGTRVFPLDFDELVIERAVNRDGTNEYAINGSRTRLKDVQELLAAANIGPSGHHIISQGEADRILSANPKERREMIEDALGLKVYQFKKAESERKLKKTRENIAQVESLRREVQPHLRFLEKQMKKIERSIALQEELKGVYADYLKREDVFIAFHQDRLTRERQEPERRRELLKSGIAEAKEKLKKDGEDETSGALVALEGRISGARKERQELVRTSGQLEGQILFLTRRTEERKRKQESEADAPVPRGELKRTLEHAEKLASEAEGKDAPALLRVIQDILGGFRTLFSAVHEGTSREEKEEAEELKKLTGEKENIDRKIEEVEGAERKLGEEYSALKEKVESENIESRQAEREIFKLMNEEREVEQRLDAIDRELRDLARAREDFKNELQEAVSLLGRGASQYYEHTVTGGEGKELSKEDIAAEDRKVQENRRRELERMKIRLEELGTGSNDDILKEYKEVKERDDFLAHEITDLTDSVAKLEALIEELANDLNEQFLTGIEKISKEFQRFFTLMFGGGSTELIRVKPKVKKNENEDELEEESESEEGAVEVEEEGIEIDVKLPNKRVRGLDMLSGGERALTSIALIFAMSQVNPPLFVILDETDAALDEANSRRYGDMISALAEKSQLILITHNRETMGRAGVLYGVTMAGDGVSKLLSVKFDEAVAVAK